LIKLILAGLSVQPSIESPQCTFGGVNLKDKKIMLFVSSALILAIISLVLIYVFSLGEVEPRDKHENFEVNDICSVRVEFDAAVAESHVNNATITSKHDIEVLLECTKMVHENNKNKIDALIAPQKYTVVYELKDGQTKVFSYTTYPSKTANYPFTEFFKLDSVIKQINPIFSFNASEVSIVVVKYISLSDPNVQQQTEITNPVIIEELLNMGREDVLINKRSAQSGCRIAFYDKSSEMLEIGGFNVFLDTYMLNDICNKYPKINEIIDIAKKNDFK